MVKNSRSKTKQSFDTNMIFFITANVARNMYGNRNENGNRIIERSIDHCGKEK